MSYKFKVSVECENIKESNTWTNILKYAIDLAKNHKGRVVKISSACGNVTESFIWSVDDNNIIPVY